jgi:hypothetical protein
MSNLKSAKRLRGGEMKMEIYIEPERQLDLGGGGGGGEREREKGAHEKPQQVARGEASGGAVEGKRAGVRTDADKKGEESTARRGSYFIAPRPPSSAPQMPKPCILVTTREIGALNQSTTLVYLKRP